MIDPKKIYTAHFIDNEQTTLEVLLGTEETGVFENMVIPYDPTEAVSYTHLRAHET